MKKNLIISLVLLVVIVIGVNYFYSSNARKITNKIHNIVNSSLTSENPLQEDDFQLGGIKLLQSFDKVIQVYGKPKTTSDDKKGETKFHDFDSIRIKHNIIKNTVVAISSNHGDVRIYRGISVGDEKEKVLYHYGEPHRVTNNVFSYFMYVCRNDLDYNYAIDFELKNDKVSKIIVYFAAD